MQDSVSFLEPGPNVRLELHTCGVRGARPVVVAKGLGGAAGRDRLVDELAAHFTVISMSPRNSGQSTGSFTLAHHLVDLSLVLHHVAQTHAQRPLVVAHSMGAHVVARLLQEQPWVDRAVLLAPLLDITEQNPAVINHYFRWCLRRRQVPAAVRLVSFIYTTFLSPGGGEPRVSGLCLDRQRFHREDVLPFLDSIFDAPACSKPLRVPTLVMLSGRTNVGLRIRNLDALAVAWKELIGSRGEVELLPALDHFLSTGEGFFVSAETPRLVDRMVRFLDGGADGPCIADPAVGPLLPG